MSTAPSSIALYDADTIRRSIGIGDVIEPVREALAAFSAERSLSPPISFIRLENDGEVHLKSGYAVGSPLFVTKIASMVPANRALDLPSSDGLMLACSARTGFPLALLHDRKYLTDIRTAAVGAVAAQLLAPDDAEDVGVLGTGGQAVLQMMALALIKPVRNIHIWGRDADKAEAAAARLREDLPEITIIVQPTAEHVVKTSTIIATTTAATDPLVKGAWLSPGQHITALGADDPSKAELDAACFLRSDFIACDSRELSARYGEISRWVNSGDLTADRVDCELGDLINGRAHYHRKASDITISKHIGIGIEDLFVAREFLTKIGIDVNKN